MFWCGAVETGKSESLDGELRHQVYRLGFSDSHHWFSYHRMYNDFFISEEIKEKCQKTCFEFSAYFLMKDKPVYLKIPKHQKHIIIFEFMYDLLFCLLYTSPSPRDLSTSRMPSSA